MRMNDERRKRVESLLNDINLRIAMKQPLKASELVSKAGVSNDLFKWFKARYLIEQSDKTYSLSSTFEFNRAVNLMLAINVKELRSVYAAEKLKSKSVTSSIPAKVESAEIVKLKHVSPTDKITSQQRLDDSSANVKIEEIPAVTKKQAIEAVNQFNKEDFSNAELTIRVTRKSNVGLDAKEFTVSKKGMSYDVLINSLQREYKG